MEGLGVGSGGVLWPCLATNTRENTGRSVLGLLRAFRDTRTDVSEFIGEVCLSAWFWNSYLLDFQCLPGAAVGSLPASWRDGQPKRLLLETSARWPPAGNGGGLPFCGGSK